MDKLKCFWCGGELVLIGQGRYCSCDNKECPSKGEVIKRELVELAHKAFDEATTCEACGKAMGGVCWECA